MRSRWMAAFVGALVVLAIFSLATSASASVTTAGTSVQAAQGSQGGGQGQGGGEEEGGATETGPPWTYQMAWITLGGVVLLLLACAFWYWRLVVVRKRGES
jgi:hypothetical protein